MTKSKDYLFTSDRLGFRNWQQEDLAPLSAMNADERVMEFFPSTQSKEMTAAFIERMQTQFSEHGYCYFAVDVLESSEFIGFIGIAKQTFEANFTPCIDIGWRIAPAHWQKGYATEGAKRCLAYAFNTLGLDEIVAIAPEINKASIQVMKKIGMQKDHTFSHPLLTDYPTLVNCELWVVKK